MVYSVKERFLQKHVVPGGTAIFLCLLFIGITWGEIRILNHFTANDISLRVRWFDVLIGLTVYLKTAIDFAIYMGHLMHSNPGWKSRTAIAIGTGMGNALGTILILLIWTVFKEVKWLLALMIFIAALVLFKLAEESLEHARNEDKKFPRWFQTLVNFLEKHLRWFNAMVFPLLKFIIPNLSIKGGSKMAFLPLCVFSFTVPFILGLDDFAGYVPLFDLINVFGFAIGVFSGHMFLNIMLYISPERTAHYVKNPVISLLGSLAFIGLGIWGLWEVLHFLP